MNQELNLNTDRLQERSNESSANNSPSSEKLHSQKIQRLIENYSEPEKAREFLRNAGIIDEDGNLMPPSQTPNEKDDLNNWRSEGRGCLFF